MTECFTSDCVRVLCCCEGFCVHCAVSGTAPCARPPWCCGGCVACVVSLCLSVVSAVGSRPVPFRTRKLSLPAPMVLHLGGCGRVGHCRHHSFLLLRVCGCGVWLTVLCGWLAGSCACALSFFACGVHPQFTPQSTPPGWKHHGDPLISSRRRR